MAVIIPRGWLRNRRLAPFDRRTPLIIPAGGGGHEYDARIGTPLYMYNGIIDGGGSGVWEICVPVKRADIEAVTGPLTDIGTTPNPITGRYPPNSYVQLPDGYSAGPYVLQNCYVWPIGTGSYEKAYTYKEAWPIFFSGETGLEAELSSQYLLSAEPRQKEINGTTVSVLYWTPTLYPQQLFAIRDDGRVGIRSAAGSAVPAEYADGSWLFAETYASNGIDIVTGSQAAKGRTARLSPFGLFQVTGTTYKSVLMAENWYEWNMDNLLNKFIRY